MLTDIYRATLVSAVYAVVLCFSVCLSAYMFVHLSHAGIVPKRLNTRSRKQRHTIAQGLLL